MAADAFESSIELAVELLEPEPVESGTCGPFQRLRRTGVVETRTFHALVLENDLLSVTIATELGGRIVRLVDKRTGCPVLDLAERAAVTEGGPRGFEILEGLSLTLDGKSRVNDLGKIDWLLEPPDEEGTAGLWIGENACGSIGMHLHLSLCANEAELQLEARLLNRSQEAVHYNGGLRIGGQFEHLADNRATVCWNAQRESGLAIWSDDLRFAGAGEALRLSRFDRLRSMAPGQLDTWTATLMPISGIRGLVSQARGLVASLDREHVGIVTSRDRPAHKVLLLTGSGETLETTVDLRASEAWQVPLDSVGSEVVALAVLSPDRRELLRIEAERPSEIGPSTPIQPEPLERFPNPSATDEELQDAGFHWPWRAFSEAALATRLLARGELEEADKGFEQSLLYNAEDHLVWWRKAACSRLAGKEGQEDPELLNAHYLAPLEPVLRAEAFLEQPSSMSADPSPLLRSFDETPLNFVEVACLLVDAGLYADATRWIDEALRHIDMVMLRYLQAYCLLVGSRLDAEAAHQVALSARLPFSPPFPFRRIERTALQKLKERFPTDEQLDRYCRLV